MSWIKSSVTSPGFRTMIRRPVAARAASRWSTPKRANLSRCSTTIIVTAGSDSSEWRDWVAGRIWPVHKTSVGGWAQLEHQRSVEETWLENAKTLAAEVAVLAERIGAQHVIVAGDVRARSLLLGHLAAPLRETAAVVEEEVTADSPAMAGAAEQALSEWAERRCRERFDDWRAKHARRPPVTALPSWRRG